MAEEITKLGATVFYFKWHTNGGFNADSAADLSCIGAFVTARAAEYGSDPDRVIVIGHSMGAEAGSKLALSSFELPPSPDCVEVGSAPTPYAFLGIGGSYGMIAQPLEDDPSTFRVRLQPVDNVREVASTEEVTDGMTAAQAYELDGLSALPSSNDLQMVLLVGSNDRSFVTKPSITAAFAEALRDHGTNVEVVEIPDANHENVMYVDTAAGQATLQVIRELLSSPP
jgi:acetyl esterase/lipase